VAPGYGIERIGLMSLRFPLAVALVVIALAIAAGFGVARINVDDSLSQLFRSDTPEFKQYEEVTRRFPSSEFDVLVVIEGKTLLARESIEKLRDLVTDLQLIDGTRGIISIFSGRQPPEDGGIPAPLFPDQLPEGAAYDAMINRVMGNEIIRGKLLSTDGELTLVVLALDPSVVGSNRLSDVVGDILTTMAEDLAGAKLNAELSGVPVMQLEVRNGAVPWRHRDPNDTQGHFSQHQHPRRQGLIQLHVRAPARTRIDHTEQIFQAIEDIRTRIGSETSLNNA
jgi:uncharacterized protein